MKKSLFDLKLLGGIFFAYLLIYVTFDSNQVFWYLYTATSLFLISFSIITEKIDSEVPLKEYVLVGIASGIALFALFFVGNWLITIIPGSLHKQVPVIYKRLSLDLIWHYIVLIFVIVPGEEIFWRGFIQKRLMRLIGNWGAVVLASAINAAAFFFSGYSILVIAAFVGGLVWGTLFVWKRSMPLLIISHLVFDLLLLMIWPLS